ncbi:histidinol-phosphate transaminase [Vibrio stylophorae]|uniref:histidinol-phosphate transaminase n=1 Tax=Vibrio stylophorae TaxID=659351 RepID=UPI001F015379|nr:histidinol-phosphate transaminase [Vibrio stylophorae]
MEQLARKNVQALTPYLSARRLGGSGDVWLNANESPFVHDYQIDCARLNRYSECQPQPLIDAYAQYAGVRSEQTLVSRGADEGIELLVRTFCEAGEKILYCPPTYGMYRICAETAGIGEVVIPLTDDWQLDESAILANLDQVKLVFICSPNNPTGNLIDRAAIERILQACANQALVVVDEAYIDFCLDQSMATLLDQYDNLVILRTLSKAFALAGLRCGFTLANPNVIEMLLKVIAPYPMPVPVTDIACQALSSQGLARMRQEMRTLNDNRNWLKQALEAMPQARVNTGMGNYLLIHFDQGDALFDALWHQGIILRRSPVKDAIRISIGNRQECERTLTAIQGFYQTQCVNA